ncbi:hypothetical protein H5410_033404 [Solanum commersonii]|uniref:Isopenicillin N synthase-like Fe(2+) 2OG dioxygenase domain-containing protein n=1 Tax=Solanum commersonii TaxID=4109 RepID=A0A9J5YNI9_SOLCO|nr:hypothetical protein H5410_033404 [Solanum commersonii]
MIVESLGVEKYMDEHINSTNYLLLLMKYKGLQSPETEMGLNTYTNKSNITILYQNQVNGLQVLTKDGQWIDVDPTDRFTVLIGDSLHVSSSNITIIQQKSLIQEINMDSKNIKLPKIDFSHEDLKPHTLVWNQVKTQVHKALVEYGCFEASFDKISIHLRKSIFESSQELFDLPSQTKLKSIRTKPFNGYVGFYHPSIPQYESMGIDDANIPHKAEKFTQILWPQGNTSFWRMILESLGVENYMDEHMNSTNYLLRLMNWIHDKAPKELVDEEHPLLCKPFTHLEFITFSYTEEGMKCDFALKTYCGFQLSN